MEKETKKQRFERISKARKDKILDTLRLIENCSNKSNYEYTQDEITELFDELAKAVENARTKFASNSTQKRINMFKNSFEAEYTWYNGFMRNVHRFGNRQALFDPSTGNSWSYTELDKVANKFSNAILSKGIKKGQVVMFQLQNCPEFVFSYIACHKTGTVASPINFRISSGELAYTIDDSAPEVFIYEASNTKTVLEALSISKHKPKTVIMVENADVEPISNAITYDDFIKYASEDAPKLRWPLSIYDETTRLYTSGTTGMPKGVCITSINEVLTAHDVMIHFPLSSNDKTMNTTPWFHRGGLHIGGITPTLYAGGCVVILRKFDAVATLKYTEMHKLTFIIGVPNVLAILSQEQEKNGYDLSSLHGIVTMGSPLERAACIYYQKVLTPNIYNGYGTTETYVNTMLLPSDLPAMAGTAGFSCVDDDVRVVKVYDDRKADPDDLVATDGNEIGEIIIKSHAKSACFYYNNEAETERKFSNGFIYTGDFGTWDKGHFVSVVGRKDDMIISGGENIYPTQIEEVLNSHPKVEDCIVTAVPDKIRGELVTAYVVRNDDTLTVAELEEFCKNSNMIANYKRPRYYRFVSEIPLNATGKKLHYKIKEIAKNDLLNGLLIRA